jgi:hypothetical protein
MHTSFTPPVATGEQFNPTLSQHNGAIGFLIGLLLRFHEVGSSSGRHARFVLFYELTLFQSLEELPHIGLR